MLNKCFLNLIFRKGKKPCTGQGADEIEVGGDDGVSEGLRQLSSGSRGGAEGQGHRWQENQGLLKMQRVGLRWGEETLSTLPGVPGGAGGAVT